MFHVNVDVNLMVGNVIRDCEIGENLEECTCTNSISDDLVGTCDETCDE